MQKWDLSCFCKSLFARSKLFPMSTHALNFDLEFQLMNLKFTNRYSVVNPANLTCIPSRVNMVYIFVSYKLIANKAHVPFCEQFEEVGR